MHSSTDGRFVRLSRATAAYDDAACMPGSFEYLGLSALPRSRGLGWAAMLWPHLHHEIRPVKIF
jgi:hypothetical protein